MKMNKSVNELGRCICGKEIGQLEFYCSDRCKWIGAKMDTPLGRNMSEERAVRFFGKQWDKNHELRS